MFKVPLIVLDAIGMRITSRPPPRPHSSEKLQPIVPDWREAFLRSLALPCILLRVSLPSNHCSPMLTCMTVFELAYSFHRNTRYRS